MTAPEGFVSVADFLSPAEQADLLARIAALDYEHDTFRGQRLRGGYAQFGHAYVSTGRLLTPAVPLPDYLQALGARAQEYCPPGSPFDQCIVTHYPAGAGIGWHVDAPAFGEVVAAVSLGSAATLQFRPNASREVCHEVQAAPGSLYVMTGPARWDYQHQVVPVESVRYSLTFRHVPQPGGQEQ